MGSIRPMRPAQLSALLAICLVLTGTTARGGDRTGAPPLRSSLDEGDLACAYAPPGTVEAVPPPIDQWAVVVCASQALVPVEGMAWFAHNTRKTVSILALPPGTTSVPASDGYDPRYAVRFKALYAAEAKEKKRDRLLSHLKAAMGTEPLPEIDRVFQLDAVSVIYDMRYNIFFYLQGDRPRFALACIDQCHKGLLMDVLTSEQMKARIAGK
jgi:hypothetical protein